jgi:hypothetical protein
VGIGIHRDAIGPHRRNRRQRAGEGLDTLAREPINQVDVDGVEPYRTGVVIQVPGQRLCLVTSDGVLHFGGEVLHAHRQPVEPEGSQQLQLVAARDSRVDFDGRFSIGVNAELPRDHVVEPFDLREGQICRRSASPMMLDDGAASL